MKECQIKKEIIGALESHARQIRKDVVTMIHQSGDGHPSPALSIADIIAALYFHVLNIDPQNPEKPDRDRVVLSKGHACTALYSALARRGFFPLSELPKFRSLHSILQGHPYQRKTPGLDATTGSLGHGVSLGLGMVLAGRVQGYSYFTYVIIGDGEQEEGLIWEAAMAAVKYRAGRLIVLADCNGLQSGGKIEEVGGIVPIQPKWEAFGWHCQTIDGHNMEAILSALLQAQQVEETPSIILARTIKGKGVPFMENNNEWHKKVPTKEELELALSALGG
ncbi:MAG: transketolase [Spirochaetes bacterium]|nr:transketolase [Spirochaetota bacterium]